MEVLIPAQDRNGHAAPVQGTLCRRSCAVVEKSARRRTEKIRKETWSRPFRSLETLAYLRPTSYTSFTALLHRKGPCLLKNYARGLSLLLAPRALAAPRRTDARGGGTRAARSLAGSR